MVMSYIHFKTKLLVNTGFLINTEFLKLPIKSILRGKLPPRQSKACYENQSKKKRRFSIMKKRLKQL